MTTEQVTSRWLMKCLWPPNLFLFNPNKSEKIQDIKEFSKSLTYQVKHLGFLGDHITKQAYLFVLRQSKIFQMKHLKNKFALEITFSNKTILPTELNIYFVFTYGLATCMINILKH